MMINLGVLRNDNNEEGNKERKKSGIDEEGPATLNIEVPLDKKPKLGETLEDTCDRNLTQLDEKEDVEIEMKCDNCSKTFCSQRKLKGHMRRNHGREVICQKCGHKAFSKESLYQHERSAHMQLHYMCDQCSFDANTQNKLQYHKKTKHDGKSYQCNLCEHRPYVEYRGLVNHMKCHDGLAFHCEYCDHESRTEVLLKRHVRTMKKNNEEAHRDISIM